MRKNPTPPHFAHLRDRYVTIVAFGDSITEINHTSHGGMNWSNYLTMGLCDKKVFPEGCLVVNTGISGNTAANGMERLDRDVLRFDPQIVIIGFGGNDADYVTPAVYKKQLRSMISAIRKHCPASVVLRTPIPMINMMSGREITSWIADDGSEKSRDLPPYAAATREVSALEGTQLVDHYSQWVRSMKTSRRGDMIRLMSDPIHPNQIGHRRLYHEIAPTFHADRYFYYEWERCFASKIVLEQGRVMP